MRNETDVANLALSMLGKPSIVSLDENSNTAALCRQNYPDARRAQLSRSDWIFARALKQLPALAEPAVYAGWTKFILPTDFVKLRAVSSSEGVPYHTGKWHGPEFRADGGYISVAGNTLVLAYIADKTDVSTWPPLFAEAVAYKLAAMIASRVTGRLKDAGDAMQLAEAMLMRAIEVDASQERHTYANEEEGLGGPLVEQWPLTPPHMHGVLPPGTEVIFVPGENGGGGAGGSTVDYVALYNEAKG